MYGVSLESVFEKEFFFSYTVSIGGVDEKYFFGSLIGVDLDFIEVPILILIFGRCIQPLFWHLSTEDH